MENENLILVENFCSNHHIDYSFITALEEYGLIKVTTVREVAYISNEELYKLEQMRRLHFDLDINLEGLDVIFNLLLKLKSLQGEVSLLRNRLKFYEQE